MQEDKNTEEYVISEDFEYVKKGDWKNKFNNFLNSRYFVAVVIVLVVIMAFALGRISGLQEKRLPVKIISEDLGPTRNALPPEVVGEVKGVSSGVEANSSGVVPSTGSTNSLQANSGQVVGSKNGTKYHYPWCGGAKQISAKNLITFDSITEARAKGYTPASNCKGLK